MLPDERTHGAQARLERLIAQIAAGLNARALYAATHPMFARVIRQVIDAVVAACDDRRQDSITFLLIGDELVVEGRPLRSGALHQQPVIRALRRCGVERLTLGRGLEAAECQQLIGAFSIGTAPASSPNVILGRIEIAPPEPESAASARLLRGERVEGEGGDSGGDAAQDGGLTAAQIDAALDAFLHFRAAGVVAVGKLEELVWIFIDALSRSARTVLPAVRLKAHDQYTFVHSVNVSLLVLAQARSFGFEGQMLHSIGFAALLHDVGKLSVPLTVLNKPGRLEGEDWKIMMLHAELGARHLCQLARSAPLSILVAYEHHLRFDGQPNYPVLRAPRRPTFASQLTSVADTYDAICTARPYRKALSRRVAIDTLRARAGTFHDPFIVGNFCRVLGDH